MLERLNAARKLPENLNHPLRQFVIGQAERLLNDAGVVDPGPLVVQEAPSAEPAAIIEVKRPVDTAATFSHEQLGSHNLLRLRLNPEDYVGHKLKCQSCGVSYSVNRRYARAKVTGGALEVQFADMALGYGKRSADLVVIDIEKLRSSGVEFLSEGAISISKLLTDPNLFNLLFRQGDWKRDWSRLKRFLTFQYKHPEPVKGEECTRWLFKGPPRSVHLWAMPLYVALYGLGLSDRRILDVIPYKSGEQIGVHTSIHRQVKEHIDQEGLELHRLNRRMLKFQWKPASDGFACEIEVKGQLDPRTHQWLSNLSASFFGAYDLKASNEN